MKRIFLSLQCFALALAAGAQSLDYLTLQTTDGAQTSFPIDGLKLYVQGQQLLAKSGAAQTAFELAALQKMFFAATSTSGIGNGALAEAVSTEPGENGLTVTAPRGAVVAVYAADGRLSARYVKTREGRETLGQSLAAGVYVVKVGEETFKVMAR